MECPSAVGEDCLIFVAAMFATLIVFILLFPKLPSDNRLKRVFTALSRRVGATVAAAPINPAHAERAV